MIKGEIFHTPTRALKAPPSDTCNVSRSVVSTMKPVQPPNTTFVGGQYVPNGTVERYRDEKYIVTKSVKDNLLLLAR